MPMLVHLAPENTAKAIHRAGIRAAPTTVAGVPRGVFCMPMLPNYFATHQWLRELKRGGQRTIAAIDFRLHADEPALFGHYGRAHAETTVGRAIGALMEMEDSQGFEIVIPRSIRRDEILRIRALRQVIGWRHRPGSHRARPCPCRVCLPKGGIKSSRFRKQLDPDGELY